MIKFKNLFKNIGKLFTFSFGFIGLFGLIALLGGWNVGTPNSIFSIIDLVGYDNGSESSSNTDVYLDEHNNVHIPLDCDSTMDGVFVGNFRINGDLDFNATTYDNITDSEGSLSFFTLATMQIYYPSLDRYFDIANFVDISYEIQLRGSYNDHTYNPRFWQYLNNYTNDDEHQDDQYYCEPIYYNDWYYCKALYEFSGITNDYNVNVDTWTIETIDFYLEFNYFLGNDFNFDDDSVIELIFKSDFCTNEVDTHNYKYIATWQPLVYEQQYQKALEFQRDMENIGFIDRSDIVVEVGDVPNQPSYNFTNYRTLSTYDYINEYGYVDISPIYSQYIYNVPDNIQHNSIKITFPSYNINNYSLGFNFIGGSNIYLKAHLKYGNTEFDLGYTDYQYGTLYDAYINQDTYSFDVSGVACDYIILTYENIGNILTFIQIGNSNRYTI